jgi:1,2-diacylglycerol 3-alpha-glucosyltransferase
MSSLPPQRTWRSTLQILMLSDVYFPRVNGVSTSIQSFRNGLDRCGIDVRLIAPGYGDQGVPTGEDDWVVRCPSRPVPFDPEDRFVSASRFVAAGRLQAPDLIHVQTPFSAHYAGLRLAKWHGVPVVATYHTFFEEYLHHYLPLVPGGLTRPLARLLSRRQCNALDALIVPSTAMRERLAAYGVTAPMHVLPTGIPLERFASGDGAAFRARHGLDPGRPIALFVGRMAHEKNIDFLIDVAALCRRANPDLQWVLAGEGPALPALRARVRELKLDAVVHFVGYLDRATGLRDCYAAANVFAFASRTETQGLVLLEAMAMGIPVIALAEMGTKDIVGPGVGAIVPGNDAGDFASAMLKLVGNPLLRKELGHQARDFARQWSEDGSAVRLASLYRDILRGRAMQNLPSPQSPRRMATGAETAGQ